MINLIKSALYSIFHTVCIMYTYISAGSSNASVSFVKDGCIYFKHSKKCQSVLIAILTVFCNFSTQSGVNHKQARILKTRINEEKTKTVSILPPPI